MNSTLYIWGRHPGLPGDAGRWGRIPLGQLHVTSAESLEEVAARYRAAYPGQEFVVAASRPENSK